MLEGALVHASGELEVLNMIRESPLCFFSFPDL